MSELSRAANTWDTIDIDRVRQVAWLSLEQVATDLDDSFAPDSTSTAFVGDLLSERFPGESLIGAALVCGDMAGERMYFENLPTAEFTHVDGYDISRVSLERYTPDGLTFEPHVVDCNRLDLPADRYHLIVALHGAHHVFNLGNFFYQANKALKPNGLLYMYEWIGPEYLQIPRTNHAVASALVLSLFRRSERTTHMGEVKGRWLQSDPSSFDPSEACNSRELYPQFQKYFRTIRAHEHGALMYPIFEGIAQNLDQGDPWTRARIERILRIERRLTRLKVIDPLFVSAVGERRPGIF
ncbi:MAG: class I SAM-dependent methyltransferase [Acidimicrobiia bacterium]